MNTDGEERLRGGARASLPPCSPVLICVHLRFNLFLFPLHSAASASLRSNPSSLRGRFFPRRPRRLGVLTGVNFTRLSPAAAGGEMGCRGRVVAGAEC